MKKNCLLITISLFLLNCEETTIKEEKTGVISQRAMVVSARVEASKIGLDILKKNGNAYDAMVATHFALAVVYPVAGNIGGGGFMVYRNNDGTKGALDFREKAPVTAHRDMYLDIQGNVIKNKSTEGAYAVGIPGSVAGAFEVFEKFGSLPFKDLIQPAIDLARNGFKVTKKQAISLNRAADKFEKVNNYKTLFEK